MNKNKLILQTSVLLSLGLAAVVATGCSDRKKNDVQMTADKAMQNTSNAMTSVKTATVDAWRDIKDYTHDKRDDFSASAKAMSAKLDAEMSEMRSNYSEAKASASRKAAMAELKDRRADYDDKMSALGRATADTWDSAKRDVIAAWDRLQASYQKAKADAS